MKYINTYKLFEDKSEEAWQQALNNMKDRISKRDVIIDYLRNYKENFPDLERIKDIFQDFFDWCYFMEYKKLKFVFKIYTSNSYKNSRGKPLYLGKYTNIFDVPVDKLSSVSFIKVYCLTLDIPSWNFDSEKYDSIMDPIRLRLSKYGFTILNEKKREVILISDLNDIITMEDMKRNYK